MIDKEEVEKLRRSENLAIPVKVWYQMLKKGELNQEMFIKLIGEKIDEIERGE